MNIDLVRAEVANEHAIRASFFSMENGDNGGYYAANVEMDDQMVRTVLVPLATHDAFDLFIRRLPQW
jgi:hypothetical protein